MATKWCNSGYKQTSLHQTGRTVLILLILRALPLIWLLVAVPILYINGAMSTGMRCKSTGASTAWVMLGQGAMGVRSPTLAAPMQVWQCIPFLCSIRWGVVLMLALPGKGYIEH